jgi:hypothetical protein
MADPGPASDLACATRDELAGYFKHMATRVENAVRSVPGDRLWTKPFPFGNSIGHLVLHLTGNLNHYVGATIAGTGSVREREKEFTAADHPDAEAVLARFHEAVSLVVGTLGSQDDASFVTSVQDNLPIKTRLGLFVVCAAHMNNHIGQMSYLVAALKPGTEQKAVW